MACINLKDLCMKTDENVSLSCIYLMMFPCNRVCLLARMRREGLKSSSTSLSTRREGKGGCRRLTGGCLGLIWPPRNLCGLDGGGRLIGLGGGLDSRLRNPPNPPPPKMRLSSESKILLPPLDDDVGGLEAPANVEARVCVAEPLSSPAMAETRPSRPGISDCSAIASHIMRSMHRN